MLKREDIACYAYRYEGNWNRIEQAVNTNEPPLSYDIRERYITVLDDLYPDCLRQLQNPPWILFYRGNIALLKEPMVTIVGSRSLTQYGTWLTKRCADILKERYVLVSGLAKGADACVHQCALSHGHTIGVIGSGFSRTYPSVNRDLYAAMARDHLILSEYPYPAGVRKEHFPWRNRILAALGSRLIVTQAALHSGTMITVNEALQLGRDIYCFPWPYEDACGAGCDRLIQEGAMVLYKEEQIRAL
ncbi:MAG: DNA-protecting protein DprA [Solobacterium sp.]|jgi:DNA processing protein|nr:DNA-protecting protein DprA [Solobacterium sp.]